jgi:hypothetical protein
MIRLEYDAQKAGMRVSWVVTDGAFSFTPWRNLLDFEGRNTDDGKRLLVQNSESLTVIRDLLNHCIEVEKENEAYRESTSHQQ